MPPDPKADPESTPAPSGAGSPAATPLAETARFEEILVRLRGLVERLESGNLPLEESLRAFEEGMDLCRRGTVILDGAEKKVELLLGNAGAPRLTPFDQS